MEQKISKSGQELLGFIAIKVCNKINDYLIENTIMTIEEYKNIHREVLKKLNVDKQILQHISDKK